MWSIIELIMEGTNEVQENQLDILMSHNQVIKSLPCESITQIFERYNKLINELRIHGKNYAPRQIEN